MQGLRAEVRAQRAPPDEPVRTSESLHAGQPTSSSLQVLHRKLQAEIVERAKKTVELSEGSGPRPEVGQSSGPVAPESNGSTIGERRDLIFVLAGASRFGERAGLSEPAEAAASSTPDAITEVTSSGLAPLSATAEPTQIKRTGGPPENTRSSQQSSGAELGALEQIEAAARKQAARQLARNDFGAELQDASLDQITSTNPKPRQHVPGCNFRGVPPLALAQGGVVHEQRAPTKRATPRGGARYKAEHGAESKDNGLAATY